jgi:hypothetical protein
MDRRIVGIMTLTIGIAACSELNAPKTSDREALAIAGVVNGFTLTAAPNGKVELPCLDGGKRILEGSGSSTTTDGITSSTWKTSMRFENCAQRAGEYTVVVNGQTQSEGSARIQGTPEPTQRPTILELQSHDTGAVTSTINGSATRSCAYDMRQTYNAATKTIRFYGTACGQPIDQTRPAF